MRVLSVLQYKSGKKALPIFASFVSLIVVGAGDLIFFCCFSSRVWQSFCFAHVAENNKYQITTACLFVISKSCMMHRGEPSAIVTGYVSGKPLFHFPKEGMCFNTTFCSWFEEKRRTGDIFGVLAVWLMCCMNQIELENSTVNPTKSIHGACNKNLRGWWYPYSWENAFSAWTHRAYLFSCCQITKSLEFGANMHTWRLLIAETIICWLYVQKSTSSNELRRGSWKPINSKADSASVECMKPVREDIVLCIIDGWGCRLASATIIVQFFPWRDTWELVHLSAWQ